MRVVQTHICAKVLGEALLLVCPDIAIARKRVLHATSYPGQKDGAGMWASKVLPVHGRNLLDHLWRVDQTLICLIDGELLRQRVLVLRDEVHMGELMLRVS